MSRIPCVVIGGGVVGLAIAKRMVEKCIPTVVLERRSCAGSENSSRSSEVLHAGIYYPKSSIKAKLCVRGKQLLKEYILERQIPYQECGKLIVSRPHSPQDEVTVKRLFENAISCGLKENEDINLITATEAQEMEPEITTGVALLSHKTAIFSSHDLLKQLIIDCTVGSYVDIVYNCEAISATIVNKGSTTAFEVDTSQGRIECNYLVNAGGLGAPLFSSCIKYFPNDVFPKFMYYAKGSYFRLSGQRWIQNRNANAVCSQPFTRLIYPIPASGGLGIHATLDLAGGVKFGPNVDWLKHTTCEEEPYRFSFQDNAPLDFSVDESDKTRHAFANAIRQYWPAVSFEDLQPDYAGIRPKLHGPQSSIADFAILGHQEHGVPNLVCLHGIESPGLTSCLAIADFVCFKLMI